MLTAPKKPASSRHPPRKNDPGSKPSCDHWSYAPSGYEDPTIHVLVAIRDTKIAFFNARSTDDGLEVVPSSFDSECGLRYTLDITSDLANLVASIGTFSWRWAYSPGPVDAERVQLVLQTGDQTTGLISSALNVNDSGHAGEGRDIDQICQ